MYYEPLKIKPRRALLFFALLALGTALMSYAVILALAAGSISLILLSGTGSFNIQILLLGLFGICVGGALLWSAIPRAQKFVAPGIPLERGSQPRLFEELESIARNLGEELPQSVYLIGDANAYVADVGGWMGFRSQRIMALGLPLVSAMTVSEFRAVLAHEFAHYYGGDTSLGPWVFKARMAMIRAFQNVGTLGGLARINVLAMLYLVVVTILKWNFRLFMRVTNFVSRKQEYRADELACLIAGVESLTGGLQKIRAINASWKPYWETEILPIVEAGRMPCVAEGYAKFVAVPTISTQIDAILKKTLVTEKQGAYDTHPPLRDRIRAAGEIKTPALAMDTRMASCLFDEIERLELAWVQREMPRLTSKELPRVPWSNLVPEIIAPRWVGFATEHAELLTSITADGLPEAAKSLKSMAKDIRNPPGKLFSQEQRAERAGQLLGIGLGLILIGRGWELYGAPAELYLSNGPSKINPFALVALLANGQITKEAWLKQCETWQIGGVALNSGLAKPSAEHLPNTQTQANA
jgi:heat shock protein HtpX